MNVRFLTMVVGTVMAGCASGSRPLPPRRSSEPIFTQGVWQIRIDVDSAPTRRPSTKPIFGTIDFAAGRYSIDFWMAISRRLPNGAHVVALPRTGQSQPPMYRITLGDSASFDEKVVFLGRSVTPDSIAGTWTETILCCSAGGRFNLWRAASSR